jgi:cyclase
MLQSRVIPCLLLKNRGLVKGTQFRDHKYVGDPINAVRIFNDKEVDEIAFLDITATNEGKSPDFELIKDIATECFIPFSYGGGITSFEQAAKLFTLGVERVILNSTAASDPSLIRSISTAYGAQSVIVSVDVKRNRQNTFEIFTHSGRQPLKTPLIEYVRQMEELGAGEILLTSIDRDGTLSGIDVELLQLVSREVSIPVIASGGAATIADLKTAFDNGASAVGAGAMFVYYGKHRAVLITYPTQQELKEVSKKITGV